MDGVLVARAAVVDRDTGASLTGLIVIVMAAVSGPSGPVAVKLKASVPL